MDLNFLIIGNGFDLTHGLPTGYIDFLMYCRDYDKDDPVSSTAELNGEFEYFIENNIWFKYFLDLVASSKEAQTWIDFEKEIAEVIQPIELWNWEIKCAQYINAPSEILLESLAPVQSEKFIKFISNFGEYDRARNRYIIIANGITDMETFVKFIYWFVKTKDCIMQNNMS